MNQVFIYMYMIAVLSHVWWPTYFLCATQDTLQTAERLTSPFMRSLDAAGWRLEKVVVEAEKRRAHW
jgi:hypothetical protein